MSPGFGRAAGAVGPVIVDVFGGKEGDGGGELEGRWAH